MRTMRLHTAALWLFACLSGLATAPAPAAGAEPAYELAFASFAPTDTDIFVARGDGSGARPLLPHPSLDSNPRLSGDGQWVTFTSRRDGDADIYIARIDGSELRRLVAHRGYDDQAALSPDGRSLAFVSTRSGQADVWVLDLASGDARNVSNHPAGDFRPSWSTDGQWIAFSSDRDSTTPPSSLDRFGKQHSTEIYLIGADGTGTRRLTHEGAFAGSPAWSADGRTIAYYAVTLQNLGPMVGVGRVIRPTLIRTVDVETGQSQSVAEGNSQKVSPRWAGTQLVYVTAGPNGGIERAGATSGDRGEFGAPDWSADGSLMVFERQVDPEWPPHQRWTSLDENFALLRTGIFPSYSPDGARLLSNNLPAGAFRNDILLMNADGEGRRTLVTDAQRNALAPVWSPRGDLVAFGWGQYMSRAPAGIAIAGPDGQGLRVLTAGDANHGFPSWSPDGRQLVYRTIGADGSALEIVDVETGAARRLIGGDAHFNFPSWSPAGDLIAFTAALEGDFEIYTIRTDGTGLARLTTSPGNDAHSAWSPDGQWIAFSSARGGFKDEAALHPGNPQPYGEIYVMRADGTEQHALTDEPFEKATPAFRPGKIGS